MKNTTWVNNVELLSQTLMILQRFHMKFHIGLYEEKYFAHTCPWVSAKGESTSNMVLEGSNWPYFGILGR